MVEGFAEADAAGVGVIQIYIRFEVFLHSFIGVQGGRGVLPVNLHARAGRAFAYGGAEVAAVAHEQERSHGFERVEQTENGTLAFRKSVGKGGEEFAAE